MEQWCWRLNCCEDGLTSYNTERHVGLPLLRTRSPALTALDTWPCHCGGWRSATDLGTCAGAAVGRRVRLRAPIALAHCGWEPKGRLNKLAKQAVPGAPTPTAWIPDLATGLRRPADAHRNGATRCGTLRREQLLGGICPAPQERGC
ncbi:hypothetical protein CGC20_34415 [Leishmania donovani]|uniref:Uncharacterized protein n=1 Tax=Leishmania donovani TaxID=5661 RepID=A0A504XHT9_LEIDO|nr:hypothetical protein CGC20_34415 [Leishmania donovani]